VTGTEVIFFSPTHEWQQTLEVVMKNRERAARRSDELTSSHITPVAPASAGLSLRSVTRLPAEVLVGQAGEERRQIRLVWLSFLALHLPPVTRLSSGRRAWLPSRAPLADLVVRQSRDACAVGVHEVDLGRAALLVSEVEHVGPSAQECDLVTVRRPRGAAVGDCVPGQLLRLAARGRCRRCGAGEDGRQSRMDPSGACRARTGDPQLAKLVLSQLS
jgi:hypothetical protein